MKLAVRSLRHAAACTLLLVTAALVRGDSPSQAAGPSMASAVRMRVPAVELKSVALGDVFDFMRDVAQLNIYVNWAALEAAGIDRSMPITLRLHQITLSRVFDLTLEQVAAGHTALSWYISDNIIYVTTRELADRDLITRVYPVQDLLVEIPNFQGPTFQLGGGSSGSSGQGGGGSVFSGGGNNGNPSGDQNTTMQARGEKLVQVIMMLVSPEVWVENGGFSSIRYFNGTIIVTAPRSVQSQIGK